MLRNCASFTSQACGSGVLTFWSGTGWPVREPNRHRVLAAGTSAPLFSVASVFGSSLCLLTPQLCLEHGLSKEGVLEPWAQQGASDRKDVRLQCCQVLSGLSYAECAGWLVSRQSTGFLLPGMTHWQQEE